MAVSRNYLLTHDVILNPGDHLPLLLHQHGKVHEHGMDLSDALLQLLYVFVPELKSVRPVILN